MMGLIDVTDGGTARFGTGHFDLIVIDEAHRSVYQRYREIFRYFDCLLVGLTATPREQVDKNTYELFDLEEGVPTAAYELERAVSDGSSSRHKFGRSISNSPAMAFATMISATRRKPNGNHSTGAITTATSAHPIPCKEHFRIFDFCFNFDFFRENPNGIEGSGGEALGTRLFRSRVQLLAAVQEAPELESTGTLRSHLDEIAIQRLRNNQPLTPTDLQSLEKTLLSIGEDEGQRLLTSMLNLHEVPTLAHLVRRIVGMARADVMYGVTMEEFGVSKPVGMRLTADDGQGNKTEAKSAAQKAALRLDA